ncbi:MAG: helix-turn-helix domain-containing protein [Rhizobiales bacterium]|nr:helix-turn-helix domain-containing protein [Hyphomicrobiales bacterium]
MARRDERIDDRQVVPESLVSVGSEMRQLRKVRGLTLKALSDACGVSVSHLSAIERGASNPSMDLLHDIATALAVSPDWFFARRPGAGPLERACIVRAQNRRNLNVLYGQSPAELGYTDQLISSSIGGRFYMGLAVYAPYTDGPEEPLLEHGGEEHGLVIEGELEMQIGDEFITLREGDSYSFEGRIPHHARNRSKRVTKLIWAVSPVVIPKDVVQAQGASTGPRKRKGK